MSSDAKAKEKGHCYQLVKACMMKPKTPPKDQKNMNIFDSPFVKRGVSSPSHLTMVVKESLRTSVNPQKKRPFKTLQKTSIKTQETFKQSKSRLDVLITSIKQSRNTIRNFQTEVREQRKPKRDHKRIVTQIDDFAMKKGIISEVKYRQPAIERLGERYFEQILRSSSTKVCTDEPFVYNIRTQKQPTKFVKLVKKLHPEIPTRHFLKLTGKKVCRTEQNAQND